MNDANLIERIQDIVLNINPLNVVTDAKAAGLNVDKPEDFINHAHKYVFIEKLMKKYARSASMYSAMSGMGGGVGGVGTMVTLGGVDIANMAAQLYRLNQKLAILNGFDLNNSLQQDRAWEIYLIAMGFDAATQTVIKAQLVKAANIAGKSGAYKNSVIKLIIEVSKKLGMKQLSSKAAAKYIPFVGGVAGASLNYGFTQIAAKKMINEYKTDYFDRWQAKQ